MTIKEKLLEEFECAIKSVYGTMADKELKESDITNKDIEIIAKKVKFYMDLR